MENKINLYAFFPVTKLTNLIGSKDRNSEKEKTQRTSISLLYTGGTMMLFNAKLVADVEYYLIIQYLFVTMPDLIHNHMDIQ